MLILFFFVIAIFRHTRLPIMSYVSFSLGIYSILLLASILLLYSVFFFSTVVSYCIRNMQMSSTSMNPLCTYMHENIICKKNRLNGYSVMWECWKEEQLLSTVSMLLLSLSFSFFQTSFPQNYFFSSLNAFPSSSFSYLNLFLLANPSLLTYLLTCA